MSERLWGVKDAAAYLGETPEWVRENCREGNLPGFKLTPNAKYWKFRPERLEQWLDDLDQGIGPKFRKHHPHRDGGS